MFTRSRTLFWSITIIMIIPTLLFAQIEYSGFADILYTKALGDDGEAGFNYGQFEVDLSGSVVPGVTFEGAIAYNADDGVFEAGAGFLDIHLKGSDEDHPARGGFISHSGLLVGQFDVPFGIDYLHIPSPDRSLVTSPLLNQATIDGWNDVGLNLYGELSLLNFNVFAVNGASNGLALGGRLGFPVAGLLEVGTSFAIQTGENDAEAVPSLMGIDFQATSGVISTRLEYQMATAMLEGDFDTMTDDDEHSGYYLQLNLDLNEMVNLPLFLVGRFGGWEYGDETASRITAGLGYEFEPGFECRAEYLSNTVNEDDPENQITIQTVVSF